MPNHSVAVGGQHVLSLVLLTTLDEAVWDRIFELRADLRYGRLGTVGRDRGRAGRTMLPLLGMRGRPRGLLVNSCLGISLRGSHLRPPRFLRLRYSRSCAGRHPPLLTTLAATDAVLSAKDFHRRIDCV